MSTILDVENPVMGIPGLCPWVGGKSTMVKWLVPLIPYQNGYCEPFGGAATILFNRKPSQFEVYNDLNSDLVNLFRIVRNPKQMEELQDMCNKTPFAREQFFDCKYLLQTQGLSPIQRAWAFLVVQYCSFGGTGRTFGRVITIADCPSKPSQFRLKVKTLDWYCQRLQNVLIEQKPAIEILQAFDQPGITYYCDPPYICTKRRDHRLYEHAMTYEKDHIDFLQCVKTLKAAVCISSFDSELYQTELAGWHCTRRNKATSMMGRVSKDLKGPGSATRASLRVECLWRNQRAMDVLANSKTLFDGVV